MSLLVLFTLGIIVCSRITAQKPFKKNTLYSELAGNGLVLSANYERQLGNKPGLGLHIGAGLGGYKPAIPAGVNYLFDLGKHKSFIEAGAGVVFVDRDFLDDKNNIPYADKSYKAGFTPTIGFRHHSPYGLMWRINYTPVFSKYRNLPVYAGISVGWRI
jgi:hypothetical protein